MVDVVILSLVTDQNSYETTKNCVLSFRKSPLIDKIFVIESNKKDGYLYPIYAEKTITVIPQEEFNYNRFLNIGKSHCTSEYIVFSNNDLIVEDNCIENLSKALDNDAELMSICPIDRNWHRHSEMYFPSDNKVYTGYFTAMHMFGCIYMMKREVFDTIGDFDERFYFFYQDNDLATTLNHFKKKHGILTSAHVKHKISKYPQPDGGEKYRYTQKNMEEQGKILGEKWKDYLDEIR